MLAFSIVGQVFNFVKRHVRRPSGAAPTQPSRKLTMRAGSAGPAGPSAIAGVCRGLR